MARTGPAPEPSPSTPSSSVSQSDPSKFSRSSVRYAFFSAKAHTLFWSVTALGFASDFISKRWALKAIGIPGESGQFLAPGAGKNPIVLIENYLTLNTLHNPGAVTGLLSGRTGLLIAASALALVFLFWLYSTSRANQWVTHIALGMLFSGALGNMYDRIFNDGKVIDFIEVDLHFWVFNPWPTFNLADVWLCVGVGVLILTFLKGDHPAADKKNRTVSP